MPDRKESFTGRTQSLRSSSILTVTLLDCLPVARVEQLSFVLLHFHLLEGWALLREFSGRFPGFLLCLEQRRRATVCKRVEEPITLIFIVIAVCPAFHRSYILTRFNCRLLRFVIMMFRH